MLYQLLLSATKKFSLIMIGIVAFSCSCSASRPISSYTNNRDRSRIIWAAIKYSLTTARQSIREPARCFVTPGAGGLTNELAIRMRQSNIEPLLKQSGNWGPPLKVDYIYMDVDSFKMLTPRTALVGTDVVQVPYPENIGAEAYGTIYVRHSRDGWIVDLKKSKMQSGE